MEKSAGAFRTIGEVSESLGIPQHILRYWESRFPQLRPMQRAGNRRYYRPDDIALVSRINSLLNEQGYTVRGVQKLLAGKSGGEDVPTRDSQPAVVAAVRQEPPSDILDRLMSVRVRLARALAEDGVAARL